MRSILFPIILIAIVIALECYTYFALKSKWNNYSKILRKTLKSIYWVLFSFSALGFILMFVFGRSLPFWQTNFLFAAVIINLIAKFLFTLFLIVDDLVRLIKWVIKKVSPSSAKVKAEENGISRSDFILKSGLIVAAVPTIALPTGMLVGPYNYTLHRSSVRLKNLPNAFNGLRIVQISDIHAGSFYNKEAVNKGIDMLLAQQPDLIFFTGDLVNNRADEMEGYTDIFSRLKAPLGVYSILGNHDYGDYEPWKNEQEKEDNMKRLKAIHKEMGWRLLLDEHVYLEKEGEKIALIGVENWGAGFHQIGDLAKAYRGCEAPVKLLLSHDPTHWDEQVKVDYKDIDITFSGHTHGAQMGIETGGFKWSPVSLRYSKWAGLYREGNQYLYINRGYGFLGYPGRIGIWPEITVMTLNKA